MKKQFIVLALAVISLSFNSCRETKEKEVETTIEEVTPEIEEEIQEIEIDSLSGTEDEDYDVATDEESAS